MISDMKPETSAAIRDELAAIGTSGSRLQRHQRRARLSASLVGVVAVAVATSAAAVFVASAPGSTTTAALGTTTTTSHTGPALVDIGRAPEGAGAVIIHFTCLSDEGEVVVATLDGGQGGVNCGVAGIGGMIRIIDAQLPEVGTSTVSVMAPVDTKWKAVLQYASSVTSKWGVNAQGQTYGVANKNGHPDLVPAKADNGKRGYVLWSEAMDAEQRGTVNVYDSDGTTIVGQQTPSTETATEIPFNPKWAPGDIATATPTK